MASPKKYRSPRENAALVSVVFEKIASVLLRLGFDAPQSEFLLRRAFVAAAQKHAGLSKTRSTQSHVALLAGVNRVDVRRIMADTGQERLARELDHQSRIERILDGWRLDPRFADQRGRPKRLTIAGPTSEFSQLTRMYGRDVTPRTVRETLLRRKLALLNNKKIELLSPGLSKNPAMRAGESDLAFLVAQLATFDFHTGRRAFVSRNLTIAATDTKSLKLLQRKAITRIGSALGGLESALKHRSRTKSDETASSRRLRITTIYASETDDIESI
jgi:hypothetical protein